MNIKLTAVATTVITYLRNCGARDEESHRSMIIINRPSSQRVIIHWSPPMRDPPGRSISTERFFPDKIEYSYNYRLAVTASWNHHSVCQYSERIHCTTIRLLTHWLASLEPRFLDRMSTYIAVHQNVLEEVLWNTVIMWDFPKLTAWSLRHCVWCTSIRRPPPLSHDNAWSQWLIAQKSFITEKQKQLSLSTGSYQRTL